MHKSRVEFVSSEMGEQKRYKSEVRCYEAHRACQILVDFLKYFLML